ncbi:MAG: hypothetical protein P8H03_06955 [Emcibacteraceae bacterium]|nr:hypothetical protein [Emcibacteraceae bacterium]MDG1859918.1 hypothetical protein [Emcibacteraceae bacterium]
MEEYELETALNQVKSAIKIKKDESRFYILKGKILNLLDKKSAAKKALEKADEIQAEAF